VEKISSGIAGLDELLYGGFLPGSSILLEGAPGTGKTTFGLQFIYTGAVQFNEPGLIITFEQFPEQIYRDSLNFGWDLQALEDQSRLRVICTSPQLLRDELEEPRGLIASVAEEIGARRILVDSITHFRRITDDSIRLRELLDSFLNGLKRQRFTSMLIKELDEVGGPSVDFETYIVDVALRVSYEADPGETRRTRYIEILKTRGQPHRSGRHSFAFEAEGIAVYPIPALPTGDIIGDPHRRVPIGITGLDEMLQGGLVGSSCALVAGAGGTGKTTLALHFLHTGVLQGHPCLFVSLEERLYKIFKAAEGYGFVRDFVRSRCFRVLCAPAAGLNVNHLFQQIQQSIQELEMTNRQARIVIDGLTDLQALIKNPTALREYLYSLGSLFEEHSITAMFTNEVPGGRREVDPIDPVLSPLMDTILYLRLTEQSGRLTRTLSILKMRASGHDMRVRDFIIDSGGIRILPAPLEVPPAPLPLGDGG
jgi:circadian clock protein KaiC